MRITKYIHSCLLVEKGLDKILFDPGKFSFVEGRVKPAQFHHLSAIVLTHEHPDHVDDDALKKILENNPAAVVLANKEIQARLARAAIACKIFETGSCSINSFRLAALHAPHAPILDAAPPQNIAYLIDKTLLHPGDSFAASLEAEKDTPVLALPLMAPWSTELEVAEFARRMSPRQIIPIHDGYVRDFFLRQRYENFQKHFSQHGIEFRWLSKPGDSIEV
jgi:L-ascorbate metabolism protein UlaG (beta-lactamase superfamily)